MDPSDLNLRHIRAFCEVARCGGISAAAGKVHLSQPAITQGLAKLERSLQVTLFARSSVGMTTTEAGALLLQRAERALDLIKAGARACHSGSEARRGKGFSNFHPLSDKRALSLRDLADYPWVIPKRGPPTREYFDALFQAAGLNPPKGLVESSSLVLIRGLLLGSDRLTLVSAHQIQHEERMGILQRLPLNLDHTARPIGTTVRRGWHPTATQLLFLDLLRQASEHPLRPASAYSEIE